MENESAQQPNLDQNQHDKWLAAKSADQLKRLAQRAKSLALSKEKSGQLSSGRVLPKD